MVKNASLWLPSLFKGKGEPEFWFVEIDLKELAVSLPCGQGRVAEA